MASLEKIVSLCKRRGFIWQSSEIYGGLSGVWDLGPMGVEISRNIKELWWRKFIQCRDDMYGIDSAILMNPSVWHASGHVEGFHDPLVECQKCKKRYRADQMTEKTCPECGGGLSKERQFNMMFKTNVGALEDSVSEVYLRPETAQGMFVNFKNVIDSFHPKIPFGIGQIGKAFRNEINPRDFTFRVREFEQMEIEYFVRESEWEKHFEEWRKLMKEWIREIGINESYIHETEIPKEERAHYSKRTIDFEFDFPFGKNELYGLAYRSDFDLRAHSKKSKTELNYLDEAKKEKFIPHVIEPTFGIERTILALLLDSYREDEIKGEKRVYLALSEKVAPVKAAVFPLLRNNEKLVIKSRDVFVNLKRSLRRVIWDDNGNIGKRYRRQDEIGTPWCITVDHDTLEDDTVTIRDRNTGEQERVPAVELVNILK